MNSTRRTFFLVAASITTDVIAMCCGTKLLRKAATLIGATATSTWVVYRIDGTPVYRCQICRLCRSACGDVFTFRVNACCNGSPYFLRRIWGRRVRANTGGWFASVTADGVADLSIFDFLGPTPPLPVMPTCLLSNPAP